MAFPNVVIERDIDSEESSSSSSDEEQDVEEEDNNDDLEVEEGEEEEPWVQAMEAISESILISLHGNWRKQWSSSHRLFCSTQPHQLCIQVLLLRLLQPKSSSKNVITVAKELCQRGILADYYRADMDVNAREKVHQWPSVSWIVKFP